MTVSLHIFHCLVGAFFLLMVAIVINQLTWGYKLKKQMQQTNYFRDMWIESHADAVKYSNENLRLKARLERKHGA